MRAFEICVEVIGEFDRAYMTYYQSAILNIVLSCTIFELFDVEDYRDLEI